MAKSGSPGPDGVDPSNRIVGGNAICSCADCGRCFPTLRGLSQHRRSAHLDVYHLAPVNPIVRKKAHWDREESVLMACEELRLRSCGVSNINQELAKCVTGRTLEAVKGQRRSSSYREILDELEQESNVPNALSGGGSGQVSPDLFSPDDTSHPVSNTARAAQSTSSVQVSPELFSEEVFTFSTHEGPPEHGRDGSRSGLPGCRQVLFDAWQKDRDTLHVSDDDFDTLRTLALSGASTTDRVQQAIDNEYATWHSSTFLDDETGGQRRKCKKRKRQNQTWWDDSFRCQRPCDGSGESSTW